MRSFPYRPVLFLVAVGALGFYAAGVNLPHTFQPGDPIRADEVNANFDTLAAAVASRAAPSESIITAGVNMSPFELELAIVDVAEVVTTSTPGRWLINKFVSASLSCSAAGNVHFYITVNDVPVRSSRMVVPSGTILRATLTGLTEAVIPAGTHQIDVYADCIGSTWNGASNLVATISSVVVFPEAP